MEIPSSVYAIFGVLVLSNLGVIITLLTWLFRAGAFVKETEFKIKDAKDCAVRAHLRVDQIQGLRTSSESASEVPR